MSDQIENEEDDLRPEYDFEKLGPPIRGKFAGKFSRDTILISLEPDVAENFKDSATVNRVLRLVMELTKTIQ